MPSPKDHWSAALSPREETRIMDAVYAFIDEKISELGKEKAYEVGSSFGFILEFGDNFAASCGLQNRPERRFQIYIQSSLEDAGMQIHLSPVPSHP